MQKTASSPEAPLKLPEVQKTASSPEAPLKLPEVQKTASSPKALLKLPEVRKTALSPKASPKLPEVNNSVVYTPAYESSSLPRQSPPGHTSQVVLPVEGIQSPGNLSVRLVNEEPALLQLLEEMNERPPPEVKGWTVGKRETVAVYWANVWYRGLAVKKTEGKFSIYLLDFGGSLVSVTPDKIRPLPAKLGTLPAASYQVCLAGVGPLQGDVWSEEMESILEEIINSDSGCKLVVEFCGQVQGGRWLVKMKGAEDVGQMLIEGEIAMAIEDVVETESPRSVVCPCGQILTSAHEAGVHIAVMHGAPFSAHILADFMWSQSAYTEYCQILKDFDLLLNIMKGQKKEIEERKEERKKK